MTFRTELRVRRDEQNKRWVLTEPLVWEGDWETLYIKPGFTTDFASVPKPLRWLLDTGGRNAAAGVLHDVTWRESKCDPATRRVDPWHADGLFRRALRFSGVAPIPRNMLWVGVRVVAALSGRLGQKGPSKLTKIATMLMWAVIALLIIGAPLIAILAGYLIYYLFGLLAWLATKAYGWYRRRTDPGYKSMRTMPRATRESTEDKAAPTCIEGLIVIPTKEDNDQLLVDYDGELVELLGQYLAEYDASDRVSSHTSDAGQALNAYSQCG